MDREKGEGRVKEESMTEIQAREGGTGWVLLLRPFIHCCI